MPRLITSNDLVHADRTVGFLHVTNGLSTELFHHFIGNIIGVCDDSCKVILLHCQLVKVSVDAPFAVTVLSFNDRFEGRSEEARSASEEALNEKTEAIAALEGEKKALEARIEELTKNQEENADIYAKEFAALTAAAEEEKAALNSQLTAVKEELEMLKTEHEKELAKVASECEANEKALTEKIEELLEEIENLKNAE